MSSRHVRASSVIPAPPPSVIPATPSVIPAEAGITNRDTLIAGRHIDVPRRLERRARAGSAGDGQRYVGGWCREWSWEVRGSCLRRNDGGGGPDLVATVRGTSGDGAASGVGRFVVPASAGTTEEGDRIGWRRSEVRRGMVPRMELGGSWFLPAQERRRRGTGSAGDGQRYVEGLCCERSWEVRGSCLRRSDGRGRRNDGR